MSLSLSLKKFSLILSLLGFVASSQAFATPITISAVGDMMLGTNYPEDVLPQDGGQSLFHSTKKYVQAADIRFGNLEDTLYDGDSVTDGKASGVNRFIFRTPTTYGLWLQQAGFNVLNMANNHSMDFGREGSNSTKQVLRGLGIQYTSKDGEVARFQVQGARIAVIGCDFYPGNRSVTTPARTYAEIRRLRKTNDIVIVSAHVGPEGVSAEHVQDTEEYYLGENRGNSIAFARGAIDAGAGLILMHGPHVPRAMEIYQNHLIAYSLGNFTTERGITIEGVTGFAPLIRVQINEKGEFLQGYVSSFLQTRSHGVIFDAASRALNLVESLSAADFPDSAPAFKANGYFYPALMSRGE